MNEAPTNPMATVMVRLLEPYGAKLRPTQFGCRIDIGTLTLWVDMDCLDVYTPSRDGIKMVYTDPDLIPKILRLVNENEYPD